MSKAPVLIIIGIFMCIISFGQDNQYEYLKLGSRNTILANAGLSRFEDQSAVIINPATLSFATGSSFAFNTTAIGTSSIKFENGLGKGYDIRYGNLNILPNTASGVLKPKKNDRDWVLGYGVYHRLNDKLRFTDRTETSLDVLNNMESPGDEIYIAQFNLGHEVSEVTAIIGVGWNLSKSVAIGFSQAFTYRGEEYSESNSASVIPQNGQGATIDLVAAKSDFYTRYYKIFTQTKMGFAANFSKWDIGLVIGLPSLGLFGQGEVMSEATLTNIRLSADPNSPRKSYFANGRQDELKATYKYGSYVGLGISRPVHSVRLYGGVNYYAAVKNFTILDPGQAEFIQPSTDSNVLYSDRFLRVYAQSKSVLNGSIGADWTYKENKHFLFSFHTDKHFAELNSDVPGRQLSVKRWDNYHISLGTQQSFLSSDWMVGIRYSFAREENALQPFSFEDPTEENFLSGQRGRGTLKAKSFQLMLSYSFRFGQK